MEAIPTAITKAEQAEMNEAIAEVRALMERRGLLGTAVFVNLRSQVSGSYLALASPDTIFSAPTPDSNRIDPAIMAMLQHSRFPGTIEDAERFVERILNSRLLAEVLTKVTI